MASRQVTRVKGAMPASSPILMNRNDEPQMRASDRNRPQMKASRSDRAAWIGAGRRTGHGTRRMACMAASRPADRAHRGRRPERLRRSRPDPCTSPVASSCRGPSTSSSRRRWPRAPSSCTPRTGTRRRRPTSPRTAASGRSTACVTRGARRSTRISMSGAPIVRKGSNGEDGYSGFTMRDPVSGRSMPTELAGLLDGRGRRAGRRVRPRDRLLRGCDGARRPGLGLDTTVLLDPGPGRRPGTRRRRADAWRHGWEPGSSWRARASPGRILPWSITRHPGATHGPANPAHAAAARGRHGRRSGVRHDRRPGDRSREGSHVHATRVSSTGSVVVVAASSSRMIPPPTCRRNTYRRCNVAAPSVPLA